MRDKPTTTKQLATALLAQQLPRRGTTLMFCTLKTKSEGRIRKMRAHLRRESVLRNLAPVLFVCMLALLPGKAPLQKTHAQDQDLAPGTLVYTQQARVTASDGATNDLFGEGGDSAGTPNGTGLALSGNTMVVGAWRAPSSNQSGAAYVYVRSGTNWSEQQKLLPTGGLVNGDRFGFAVDIDGDTAVVGARGKNINQGAAYVFVRSGTTWSQQQQLTASDGVTQDQFGTAVAISGNTIIVGAWMDNVGANTRQGSAYVFTRSGSTWTQQQKLTASDGATNDLLGSSVAIVGDTAVVGATHNTFVPVGNGQAYVFTRSGTTWTEQQKLTASDGASGDAFGNAVAINTNANTIAVGAHRRNEGSLSDRGAVYVYVRSGSTWSQQQKLLGSLGAGAASQGQFGCAVAVDGDTIIAAASQLDAFVAGRRGVVYIFDRSGTTWTEHDTFTMPPGLSEFGTSVSMSGDSFAASADRETVGLNASQGAVYIFATGHTLSISGVSLTEGNSGTVQATFAVTLSGAETHPVIVNYATSDVTATAGSDYVATSGILTFNPGETSKTINVAVNGDTLFESDETFSLDLSNPVNATIAQGHATGTIINDDSPPSISINDVVQAEGNSGTTGFTFTATLSAPSGLAATVNYATADGTASAGSDYQATSGVLTFSPGQISKQITVLVNGDTQNESDETFLVNLSNPVSATISRAQGTGTISNDDPAVAPAAIQFSLANYSVGEGAGHVDVSVTRTGDTSSTSSVDYRTTDTDTFTVGCSDTVNNAGGAYGRCDYATSVDTLTFLAGETTKTFAIPIIDDSWAEGNETFNVVLSNVTGASLGAPTTATITIIENDTVTGPNPIFTTHSFVRQHYLDFLSREPEVGEPWTAVLNNCSDVNNNPLCDRLTVSAAFFGSPEFQLKGYFVYRFYKLAFNRLPTYLEIVTDMRSVTGQTPAEVYQKKAAFANAFVQRTEFTAAFGGMTNDQYVAALMGRYTLTQITTPDPAAPDGTNKVTLTTAQLQSQLTGGTLTRAQVLRAIADSDQVLSLEFNQAFVAMQYYGYLRRAPETAGFNAWLAYLTAHPTDSRTMVNGFMNSVEYRLRFGPPNP